MRTVTERLDALEERAKKAEKAIQGVGVFGVTLLQETLNQLVDERRISATTRSEIWRRMRTAIEYVSAFSPELVDAANAASPRDIRRVITGSAPRQNQTRSRKPVLRLPESDQ